MTLLPFEWPDAPGPGVPRLSAALRSAVTRGRLAPGERLPSSRVLAQDLGVSRWLVTEAYAQLEAEGYLTGRTGSGTYVAAVRGACPPAAAAARVAAPVVRHDLRPNLPDLRSFPTAAWRVAAARAVAQLGPHELGYPDPRGDARLRVVLADYLRRVRGLEATADDVLVTSGTGHSLSLLFRALAAAGHRDVAVEDPGWWRVTTAARAAGLRPVPVPVDGDGLDTDRLAELDVSAVFVTPAHQFPTGVALTAVRRQRLLAWATAPRLVVEDDDGAEFRYDRRPVAALAALGGRRVAYLGSTSKTLAPGLRIGWLVLPGGVGAAVRDVLEGDPSGPSTLDQRTLAELVASGAYDTHLRRMRRTYRSRRAALVAGLQAALPPSTVVGMDAGVHCLLPLPAGDDVRAARRLAREGISVVPLRACQLGTDRPPGLLLGFAGLASSSVAEVVAAVAAVVADEQRRAGR